MLRIQEEFLNTLRERVDIVDFVSDYVTLKKAGRLQKGLCPFHSEKTPSFVVYPENQSFYCYGCGKGGDIITFARDIENLDYVDAVKLLADRAGLPMPEEDYDDTLSKQRKRMLQMNQEAARFFYHTMMSSAGSAGLRYWTDERRLTMKTIRHFGLGYAPDDWHALHYHMNRKGYTDQELYAANLIRKSEKNGKTYYYDSFHNRVMVPIIDLRGNVIAFGGRVLDGSIPKYVNTSDTLVYKKSQAIFALNFAKSSGQDSLILCEGYMDVIALHQAGFTNAVACLGTALTDEQVRLLSRYCKEIILSYDSDEAGRKATDRALSKFGKTGIPVRSLTYSGGKDPDEIIKNFGAERFRTILQGASNETEYRLNEARKKYDTATDDGKVRFLRDAVRILAGLENPIERDVYMSRLSAELDVSKDAIRSQVEDQRRRSRYQSERRKVDFGAVEREQRARAPKGSTATPRAVKAEETILSSLLRNPDYLERIDRELLPEDFATPFGSQLYVALRERLHNDQSIEPIYLSGLFTEEEMGKISRLWNGTTLSTNTWQEVLDCIRAMKKEKRSASASDPADLSDEEFRKLFSKS
ncbi:MAG: DNA primase [Clostridia bacterium]|nr:DNA primase [Clostridia bacterium]